VERTRLHEEPYLGEEEGRVSRRRNQAMDGSIEDEWDEWDEWMSG
jgi:hypothetical protein